VAAGRAEVRLGADGELIIPHLDAEDVPARAEALHPSAAAARVARAVAEDSGAVLPACAEWTASTASPACTWTWRPRSASADLRTAAEAVRAKRLDVASL
jgi:hypothetical protein